MNRLTERIARLSPQQRRLLEKRLRNTDAPARIPRATERQRFPLSYSEQRLWFLDQFYGESPFYNISFGFHLRGIVDIAVLRRVLTLIVRRHETLRSRFEVLDGEPWQVVLPAAPVDLPVVDLGSLDAVAQRTEAKRWNEADAVRPFSLTRGTQPRAYLIRFDSADFELRLSLHHIVFDAWSLEILVQEITALYASVTGAAAHPLPELPIQYGDFALWQRQQLSGDALAASLAYWKDHLADLTTVEFPLDHPRPAVQTYRGRAFEAHLSGSAMRALKALAHQEKTTLFVALLTAFTTLIRRYAGQNDVTVGAPIANRNHSEVEGLIGFFASTLVLRSDFAGNPPFRELIRRCRAVTLHAFAHQDVPFEQLVEHLQPERDASRHPLFQIVFALQQSGLTKVPELPGIEVSPVEFEVRTARFDLEAHMWERADQLAGLIEYNSDLFDASTVARLWEHFRILLEAAVHDPEQRLADLPLLSSRQEHQLLREYNDTDRGYLEEASILDAFTWQVERQPESLALSYGNALLTYGGLSARANRLAHYLRALGIGPEDRVAIFCRRSTELIVAILGALRAGGAYVPLDPAYPKERLTFMLDDARAGAVLTQQSLVADLPPTRAPVVRLDADREILATHRATEPDLRHAPGNLAYVIYTSGSTGRPKGVAITHRSAVTLLCWGREVFPAAALRRVLASTSICFDLSVYEIFLPLRTGGQVILVDNALALTRLPAPTGVTLINTVPSAITELLHAEAVPPSLRIVNLAGEPLKAELVRRIFEIPTVEEVYNLYGPSEDTTYSTWARLPRSPSGAPSIGRPTAETRAFLLDPSGRPVSMGVHGELFLGGGGLARGYLDRPALTAERFVPDSFGKELGARLYRTGDLVRRRIDGQLDFLGRIDHQIKLRGHRIELGEIEARLQRHPGVRETVVLVRKDLPAGPALVAYLVEEGDRPAPGDLRAWLAGALPRYMIPSFFIFLERLPLTPNGKIDRRALPSPESPTGDREGSYLPPRDSLELELVRIWESTLRVGPIGARDTFFDLGGHSLMAVRMMAEVKNRLGHDLPISVLFQASTVEKLAEELRGTRGSRPLSPLVEIQPLGDDPPLFWVHPMGGNVLCYVPLARYLGTSRPFYAFQAPGLDEDPVTYRSFEEMAATYIEELLRIRPEGPFHLGGYCYGGGVAFEMAHQLRDAGHEIAQLVMLDTRSPASLEDDEAFDDAIALSWFARDLAELLGKSLRLEPDELRRIPKTELLAHVLRRAREIDVLPGDVGIEQIERYFHLYIANSVALLSWEPTVYPGRITLFRALDEDTYGKYGWTLGWDQLCSQKIEIVGFSGDHFSILYDPHVEAVARKLLQLSSTKEG